MLDVIEIFPNERKKLYKRFADKLEIANNLNRKVVSFQANKNEPFYRWFKYKEGFSSSLVKYFLKEYSSSPGKILDPFAGVGTTLFTARELGWESYGIELLPVGVFVIKMREAAAQIKPNIVSEILNEIENKLNNIKEYKRYLKHISITKEAFSEETEIYLNKYLTLCDDIKDENINTLFRFAAFSVLEEISYTRKDGQYLRWDYRANRELNGKPFNKGKISSFQEAINHKLHQILIDLSTEHNETLFTTKKIKSINNINIIEGTILEELPNFKENFFDFILTSPPYCNRYDYTRTYALELVFLGYDNNKVNNLRQSMLSCTVENKEKIEYLRNIYSNKKQGIFEEVIKIYNMSKAMQEVNFILDELNKLDKLNNKNIPRMVKNYFLELCFVIYELSRILKVGRYCVMVNDNVRYGGEEIPVDLILSEFAEIFGFDVEKIFILPTGKGNSSQQMGKYGKTEVRKCVYLWRKI